MPKEKFSFDELREKLPGDYEQLKEILFVLLGEDNPSITQVFDQSAKAMRFVREVKMKLLRVHIIKAETCGGLLDELDLWFRDPIMTEYSNFDPLCFIGPNGAGKSQFLQVSG